MLFNGDRYRRVGFQADPAPRTSCRLESNDLQVPGSMQVFHYAFSLRLTHITPSR